MGEDTLSLNFLNESGEIIKLKLPRILKSTKRSHSFCFPGTIWNIVLQGNPRDYMVPKEMNLIFSPIPLQITYKELELFSDIFKLTDFLMWGDIHRAIYSLLYELMQAWPKCEPEKRNLLVDSFYIEFLKNSGYLKQGWGGSLKHLEPEAASGMRDEILRYFKEL